MQTIALDKTRLARFYLELQELEEELAAGQAGVVITREIKNNLRLQGQPVLAQLQPKIAVESFRRVLLKVARALQKWQSDSEISDEEIAAVNELDDAAMKDLVETMITGDVKKKEAWAGKLGLKEETFDFLSRNVSRLFLKSFAAEAAKQLELDKWNKGYCPVCGDSPAMARLTENRGKRKLQCSRCETQWDYPRLGCPFCGTTDTDRISFMRLEDNKKYRLYLCDECKSFLKTVDERENGETDLFCEDIATLDLDRLAVSEGYRRGKNRYYV